MRYLTSFLALLILIESALAARPDVRTMTCRQAQQMVAKRGAVVMTTGRFTYERFVSHSGYCDYFERAASAWTKTKDNSKCRIGFTCEQRIDNFGLGKRF